ncbi:MAG: orotate phosphoribosyltransferase [Candidatus Melainabacteria bacterium]|nr:orotate phosphoribosyltransferase [Candidatus Melainabacteria bacterium]
MRATSQKEEIKNLLIQVGAWQQGHFLLTSGKHSDAYMQCQRIMQYPRLGAYLANLLVDELQSQNISPTVVVGPAMGAIHWEVYVAQAIDDRIAEEDGFELDTGNMTKAVFAERPSGSEEFEIRRGIELTPKDKILIVEDVTTTGGSLKKVYELLKKMGCTPVAAAALLDRSGGKVKYDVPFVTLLQMNLETYEPADCPMCKEGKPVVKPGSSKK